MAKRSPILGYNHNVRHRGLVFHVQTEDSGVQNPHIFTHLFHGGVILSSRRLNYDNGAAEESVKSLMQAQHKAVLKDLKGGTFDAKIDEYLGGTPGLEPARPRPNRDTLATPPPPSLEPDPEVTPPAGSTLGEALLTRVPGGAPAGRSGGESLPPPLPPPPRPAPPSRDRGMRNDEVSAAFRAIGADDMPTDPRGSAVPTMADDEETTPVPSTPRMFDDRSAPPAPAGGEAVPVARNRETPSGAYVQHRRGRADTVARVHDQPTAPVQRPRPGRPSARPPPVPARAARPGAPSVPPPHPPSARSAAGTVNSSPPRPGVVVSRPAVIVGGPPRVVGTSPPAPRPPAGRRAREEAARPSLFGKDLISEKSLDEVILAYLSEDSPEE